MRAMIRWPVAAASVIAALCFVATATDGVAAGPKDQSPASIEEVVAGKVTRIKGSAIAIQNAQPRILGVGSEIQLGDIISTGANSRLELRMSDDSVFNLGEKTNFVVMEYDLKQNRGSAAFRLMSGALNVVSGKIAALGDSQFRIETELATVGIRGTEIWLGTLGDHFEVAMWSGTGVSVKTRGGEVVITEPNQGVLVRGADTKPDAPEGWARPKLAAAWAAVCFISPTRSLRLRGCSPRR